ncbi:MAG: HAMP domain-containing histidine kinase [Acidobacteria bacterium]|nr:HAMP domain-containing histidine kinase [Acidobacteriota bacterium]
MKVSKRTTLAAVLIGVAVLLPTSAWYVTGSREAARRAAALEARTQLERREEVEREAARLGSRLEALRAQESERPFFHYQTLYRDPRGAAEGLAVTRSPLASGATDPLVLAHFQIDEHGLVTLPTVSERFPELSSDEDFGAFCTLLEELQTAVLMDEGATPDTEVDEERVLTLTGFEWEQIALADAVYASITGRQEGDAGPAPVNPDLGRVVVRVRPLRWHTMVLGSGPTLAALRDVHTPAGVVLQGFAVAKPVVDQWLGSGSLPLRFTPGPPPPEDEMSAPVGFTGWILDLDHSVLTTPASAEARTLRAQFHRTFALTVGGIALAAVAVIMILFQTDRTARQRARFAAAAAHELKTPLASLQLHAEMLAEDLGEAENRTRYAATVSAEADRLGRVVTNMLDLTRLERSAPLVNPRAGDIAETVRAVFDRERSRLEDAGVTVRLDLQEDLPDALFDSDALRQILDNLLDNAEKHTRDSEDRSIEISVVAEDDQLRIEVADNGPGIPRSQRRSLFRPFDRAENAVGRPGLGLGLAVSRTFARAQGGDLELDGSPRQGATFVLTLPQA